MPLHLYYTDLMLVLYKQFQLNCQHFLMNSFQRVMNPFYLSINPEVMLRMRMYISLWATKRLSCCIKAMPITAQNLCKGICHNDFSMDVTFLNILNLMNLFLLCAFLHASMKGWKSKNIQVHQKEVCWTHKNVN